MKPAFIVPAAPTRPAPVSFVSGIESRSTCPVKQSTSRTFSWHKSEIYRGNCSVRFSSSAYPRHSWNSAKFVCIYSDYDFSKLPTSDAERHSLGAEVGRLLQGANLYLVGLMGSGKSTISDALANAMSYNFLDTDTVLEKAVGKTVPQIFAEDGEETFRAIETQVLMAISGTPRCVVATGGGVVLKPQNWGYMQLGVVVYLDVPIDVLHRRLSIAANRAARPLLQQTNSSEDESEQLMKKLQDLMLARVEYYHQADVVADVHDMGVEDATGLVLHRVFTRLTADQAEKRAKAHSAINSTASKSLTPEYRKAEGFA